MQWPPTVLARLALDAGMTRDGAVMAVAVSRRLTGGDDAFLAEPATPGGTTWYGLYAIPGGLIEPDEAARALTATGNTAIMVRLAGRDGTNWSWLPNGLPELREGELAEARYAVERPAGGIIEPGPNPVTATRIDPSGTMDAAMGMLAGIDDALASEPPPL